MDDDCLTSEDDEEEDVDAEDQDSGANDVDVSGDKQFTSIPCELVNKHKITCLTCKSSKTAKAEFETIFFLLCQQEGNSKLLPKEVCSSSHGMTPSELGQVVRADHDYIDLLVNVKHEASDDEIDLERQITVPLDIKEEVIDDDDDDDIEDIDEEDEVEMEVDKRNKEMFDNLATLADVSLATAGKLEADQSLRRKIDQARAKITSKSKFMTKTILPITPEMSSKRTMQVNIERSIMECSILYDLVFSL